ncbi:hypothetical protein BDV32DRAFT_147610 [Aspergillus pseudonomiae]|uniref:Uncharacterized protein n=1 Tax=Aspergillus pseudonomiae TaxID=1506151 RepID=A0A5N6I7E1_9EURO|nr:uncharacterized protein BDV37DRAFT_280338 [Aspergillus pseudonomiae]KAB8262318.1 hypothetical protein BDV32DRAFT_147610 [Aspergillus pseudonomiae]KAE8407073.1 hypothetical protein BDV37DRAFT_280338 [Aspergillus pseudonomiae]
MSGLHPINIWFENGWPQSWQWTMLAPHIRCCPEGTAHLAWQNFPTLQILNNTNTNRLSPDETPNDGSETVGKRNTDPSVSDISKDESCLNQDAVGKNCASAIAHNRSEPLSYSGKQDFLEWQAPGKIVGPNDSYITTTTAGEPKFVVLSSQLNLTYSPLTVTGDNTGYTYPPEHFVYGNDGIINGTMAIMLTDLNLFVTPFNLTMLNPHLVALGLYMTG